MLDSVYTKITPAETIIPSAYPTPKKSNDTVYVRM
jgi:hypothetical protein